MCVHVEKAARHHARVAAAAALAEILSEHFSADITPAQVQTLLRDRWDEVARLAHKIHDDHRMRLPKDFNLTQRLAQREFGVPPHKWDVSDDTP